MSKEITYIEKQYLGYNKFSLTRRMFLAIFCFLIYFFSDKIPNIKDQTLDMMFLLGISILVISGLLVFVLHMETKIENGSLIIDGLWTARKVKIDLSTIKSAKKIEYSKYLLNRPVYNLHRKGKIKFFTRGTEAVELTDKDGLIYVIGSQRADEFCEKIIAKINLTSS